MRKLIMWNVISLDGYLEGEKAWDLEFHDLAWGKELENFSIEQLKSADMVIYGEKTYKGMAEYWSKAEGETAASRSAVALYWRSRFEVRSGSKIESS